MPFSSGPNTVSDSSIVFNYDLGDNSNSWTGQPGTNITTGVARSYNGYSRTNYGGGVFFETNGYTEMDNIPALGLRTVESVEINNSSGNINCCVNLFSYTGGWNSLIWAGSTTYTYQIIYKTRSGYTHPNFMYQYQYDNAGNYITEFGSFDGSKQESLGGGWFHAWNTFTTQPAARRGFTGLWYYQYNVADKVSVAAISIVQGSNIRPAKELIPSSQTRFTDTALRDISGRQNIITVNTSYSSNGQIVFDGTDDYLNLNTNIQSGFIAATYEFVCRPTSLPGSGNYHQLYIQENSTWIALYNVGGTPFFGIDLGNGNGWFDNNGGNNTGARTTSTISANTWYHLVYTWESGIVRVYLNGVLQSTTSTAQAVNGRQNVMTLGAGNTARNIGSRSNGSANNWIGNIPVVKFYNRGLTQAEVTNNYNEYKTRFNLP